MTAGAAVPGAAADGPGDSLLQVAREIQDAIDQSGPSELTTEVGLYTLEEWVARVRALAAPARGDGEWDDRCGR